MLSRNPSRARLHHGRTGKVPNLVRQLKCDKQGEDDDRDPSWQTCSDQISSSVLSDLGSNLVPDEPASGISVGRRSIDRRWANALDYQSGTTFVSRVSRQLPDMAAVGVHDEDLAVLGLAVALEAAAERHYRRRS